MKLRLTEPVAAAAAKAAIGSASAYRVEDDQRLPSQKQQPRGRRRPDPLIHLFDAEVVPMLKAAPLIRGVAVLEELQRRYQDLPRGVLDMTLVSDNKPRHHHPPAAATLSS